MQNNSLLATLAGAAAFALAAHPAAAPPPSGGVDWSGPYVGLNLGWNGAGTQASAAAPPPIR
jgi:hypothetical protein